MNPFFSHFQLVMVQCSIYTVQVNTTPLSHFITIHHRQTQRLEDDTILYKLGQVNTAPTTTKAAKRLTPTCRQFFAHDSQTNLAVRFWVAFHRQQ